MTASLLIHVSSFQSGSGGDHFGDWEIRRDNTLRMVKSSSREKVMNTYNPICNKIFSNARNFEGKSLSDRK